MPIDQRFIRLAAPRVSEEALAAVREVLTSGWLVQGERVAAFERGVAELVDLEHAVAVSSGTSALHTALLGLGIGPGDAVAVSAYSYVATANVVEMCGAEPLFVDVDRRTFNMEAGRLEALLEERGAERPVAAIVVVHAFGQMADVEAVGAVAERFGVPVIEDAACALGARWNGRPPGATTRAACFSFHPRKAITTGEGGMVVTADADLAAAARRLRNHGLDADAARPDFVVPGLNYRLTEFQAVLGSHALRLLEPAITRRRELAGRYDELLADVVEVPFVPDDSEPVYQSYVVLLPGATADERDAVIAALARGGIESTIGTFAIPTTTYYRNRYGYDDSSYPVTSELFARSLSLPLHDRVSDEDQQRVADELRRAL